MKTLQSIAPRLPAGMLYGGDYNPEQWPEDVWQEDVRLMREAGVNLVSLGIFSWAKLEPTAGVFEFGWLDRIVGLLAENKISICLATATASPPPWFSTAYPESLPVDVNGVRYSPGSRQHYCPNSPEYREAGHRLVTELARRYAPHPAVALWHVNNEIGCHSYECFCDGCARAFRRWLRERYGTLEKLNKSWGTAFWSQAYSAWEQILPPRRMLTFRNPGQVLDYARFMSGALTDILAGEVDAIRRVDPTAKVVTNGLSFHRPVDYFRFYQAVDIAAWDSYPDPGAGLPEISFNSFNHDLFRGLRRGTPFIMMEQAATQVNWRPLNFLKPPGQMRALSMSAVARGAEGVMFFQWRQSKAGAEKFHSAMVPHAGAEGSRVFQEVAGLGADLRKLAPVCGTRIDARVALVVSWENRWALELESKPRGFDYARIVGEVYGALWGANVAIDVRHPDDDLSSYAVVVAPALYQITAPQAEKLRSCVRDGGTLVMTYFSGVVDEREHIWPGGYLGSLTDVFGLAVEEWQPLGERGGRVRFVGDDAPVSCKDFCDVLRPRTAEVLARYETEFFAGSAAVTKNRFGKGRAYYLGTGLASAELSRVLGPLLREHGMTSPIKVEAGVEATVRRAAHEEFLFVINHLAEARGIDVGAWSGNDLLTGAPCSGQVRLEAFGVRILRREVGGVAKSPRSEEFAP